MPQFNFLCSSLDFIFVGLETFRLKRVLFVLIEFEDSHEMKQIELSPEVILLLQQIDLLNTIQRHLVLQLPSNPGMLQSLFGSVPVRRVQLTHVLE